VPFPLAGPRNFSRRGFLLSAAAGVVSSCAPAKPVGFRGYCLVANRAGRDIGVVDLLRFRLRQQIPLGVEPTEIVAHPSATRAFALAPDSGSIFEVETEKLAVSRRARIADRVFSMALAPADPSRPKAAPCLWALCREPAELVELPLDSFAPRRRIRLPAPPDGLAFSANGMAAISHFRAGAITLVSLGRAAVARTITVKQEPSLLHFRQDGAQLIAGSQPDRALTIYDAASGAAVVRLPVGLAPRNFCADNSGGQLYVSGDGMDSVVVVYPYETEIGKTILAGHAPGAMAVTQGDAPLLLVANPGNDRVTALDANRAGARLHRRHA
jgi:hypothetical protein